MRKRIYAMNTHVRSPRQATNLSIRADLIEEAKALDINVSRAAEAGIANAVRAEKERRWKNENAQAFREWNQWVEENGLPFAEYRQF